MSVPQHLRVYRWLLRLFPRDFREVRGDEMERLFLDMSLQWVEERGGLGARFWASLFWDTGKEALGEWISLVRDEIRSDGRDDRRSRPSRRHARDVRAVTVTASTTATCAGRVAGIAR